MHASTRSTPPTRELRPEHALLTPMWLAALALLVANDHWLKGSGLLPGVLTGKLSDFAGMLVAPVLLASLLRVGTRRGLMICHVAVVLVFSGIQLSPDFANLWSGLMGLVGYPWVITCDPTDLIALPFAWLSWQVLTPAMDPDRPALVGLRRTAVAASSVFGLWATVATSRDTSSDDPCWDCWQGTGTDDGDTDGGDGDGDGWQNISGDVYIHNPNEFDISVTIRVLEPEVGMDCEAIANDPSRLLPDDAFGPAEHWLLPPTTNAPINMNFTCGAAKVGGEGIPEQIVFSTALQFNDGSWTEQDFPGSHDNVDELGPLGAAILMGPEGTSWIGGENWRFTPKTDPAPQPEQCLPEPNERRIDWSELNGDLVVQVLSKTAGLDGCFEIELSPWLSNGFGPTFLWYLCAPPSSVKLEVGSHYKLVTRTSPVHSVEAQLVDPVYFMPATNELGHALFTARWVRGQWGAAAIPEIPVTTSDAPMCPWAVAEDCSIVERKLDVSLGGGWLDVGVTGVYVDALYHHEFTLSRARALALVDASCADGSTVLPHDIDYAFISEALIP